MSRTIHFVSLGCAKNRVDTEVMLGVSDESGFRYVADPGEAEVIVVNTCGFIGPAKEESIDTILDLARFKEAGSCEKLVVAGCLSQRYAGDLAAEMPEVDHFLGSSDMLKLGRVLAGDRERMLVGNPAEYTMRATDPRRLTQSGHSAYLKIAEGCNRTCSFCAIPGIRGKQRSRSVDDVVAEARRLVELGVVELNVVSQDTVSYGRDLADETNLAKLVEALAEVDGLRWIRLHYLYPESLTKELVAAMGRPNVLPYVDMPLQHAADGMLRRMRRGHGGDRLYRVVDKLRAALPDMVFRTTFLLGHPGETDAEFEELTKFVSWAEFDHVGAFVYSHEEGTRAGDMDEQLVPSKIAKARHRALMKLQRPISRRKLKSRIGTEIEVLVDGESSESEFLLEGRYWGQAPDVDGKVFLANGTARPGEIRKAIVTAAADYDLVADLLGEDGTHDSPVPLRKPKKKVALPMVRG